QRNDREDATRHRRRTDHRSGAMRSDDRWRTGHAHRDRTAPVAFDGARAGPRLPARRAGPARSRRRLRRARPNHRRAHQEPSPQSWRGDDRHHLRHRLQTGGVMRIVTTLRGRLMAMVAALLAVIMGSVAVISTRVAHYEIRKFEVEVHAGRRPLMPNAVSDYYHKHGSWPGVEPAVEAMARTAGSDVALFDEQNRLAATSNALRGATLDLAPDGTLTITRTIAGGRARELIRGPQMIVRDANGGAAGSIFILPPHNDAMPTPTRSLDRSFFWIFLGATVFGIVMAIAIARWIIVPVERLTAAARRMESGDLVVRVKPDGGAELAE